MTDVHKLTLQTRPPRGSFHGAVEIGYYCVADGHVVLCDKDGRPTGDGKRALNEGGDARLIAVAMMKSRRRNSGTPTGWNDKLQYPRVRY
jgi:hypothetical protein